MKAFVADIVQPLGPMAATYLDVGEFIKRAGTGYSIDMNGLIKSDEQVQEEQKQQQMAQMTQNLGPHAINAAGGLAKQALANQGPTAARRITNGKSI
jgi:hypothetical protein